MWSLIITIRAGDITEISGFSSKDMCEKAKKEILDNNLGSGMTIACVEKRR